MLKSGICICLFIVVNEDYILVPSSFTLMSGSNSVTANSFVANNDDTLELTEDFNIQVEAMAIGEYYVFGRPTTINILDSENTGEYLYMPGGT